MYDPANDDDKSITALEKFSAVLCFSQLMLAAASLGFVFYLASKSKSQEIQLLGWDLVITIVLVSLFLLVTILAFKYNIVFPHELTIVVLTIILALWGIVLLSVSGKFVEKDISTTEVTMTQEELKEFEEFKTSKKD